MSDASSAAKYSLDGDVDALLAPIRGQDDRRELPREMFQRRPRVFLAKFGFAVALIAGGYAVIALGLGWAATVAAGVVLGLMYAHLVELQHECLHGHAFNARRWNRFFGVLAGVFMLSSHSHYRYQHLRHHAYLGTPNNKEFFNYRFRNLDSVPGFLAAAFHLGRYADVARDVARSLLGRPIPGIDNDKEARRVRQEYRFYALCVAAALGYTLLAGDWLFVFAWLLPAALIAEATHFMIELPEHYGLNTQSEDDVLANTRTIRASRLAEWFTNCNNLHTAHHYHQGVPMAQVRRLNARVADRFQVVEPSYWSFYRGVIRGDIRHDPELGSMTR